MLCFLFLVKNHGDKVMYNEKISSLLGYIPYFERTDYQFYQWTPAEKDSEGTIMPGYPIYDDKFNSFISVVYDSGLLMENYSDFLNEHKIREEKFPGAIKKADLETLSAILTYIVRSARFSFSGYTNAIDNQLFLQILYRLRKIHIQSGGPNMEINKFPGEISEKLNYYVYLYSDPDTNEIFYVGKGKGDRVFAHLSDTTESEKNKKITEIKSRRKTPKIEILVHGLDEDTALRVEAAVIDLIGIDKLTNKISGYKSNTYGRLSVEQLIQRFNNTPANITEPAILIRINQQFHYGMSDIELYDATRSNWKLGESRNKAQYAFAVYNGIVQEVYEIKGWFRGGDTMCGQSKDYHAERWEFVGKLAPQELRDKYKGKSVADQFPQGGQNPIKYVNIKE